MPPYLILQGEKPAGTTARDIQKLGERMAEFANDIKAEFARAPDLAESIRNDLQRLNEDDLPYEGYLDALIQHIDGLAEPAPDDDYDALQELRAFIGVQKESLKVFKRPEVLAYMASLQKHLKDSGLVGKTTSMADVVCKVNQELIDGKPENFRIPETSQSVAECFLQFQQGHRPQDLWHMTTPDYMQANIWVQMNTGNSMDMRAVVEEVDAYIKTHKPPVKLIYRWAGLHYINHVMEDVLISGHAQSLMGSFIIVFIMMAVLFRSLLWGLLCMAPLTITIVAIYGIVGLTGKDYDLPIAVLGVLALGMAVDFAIHFLQRARVKYGEKGNWKDGHFPHVRGAGPGHQPERAGHRHRISAAHNGALNPLQNHGRYALCHHESFRDYHAAGPAVHIDPCAKNCSSENIIIKIDLEINRKLYTTKHWKLKGKGKMKKINGILFIMTVVLLAPALWALADENPDAMPADEIIRKANHAALYQGHDSKGKVKLVIMDKQGASENGN